jgi:hypothetical protein
VHNRLRPAPALLVIVWVLAASACGTRVRDGFPQPDANPSVPATAAATDASRADADGGDDLASAAVTTSPEVDDSGRPAPATTAAAGRRSPPSTGTPEAIARARARVEQAGQEKQRAEADLVASQAEYERSAAAGEAQEFQDFHRVFVAYAVARVADAEVVVAVAQNELDYQTGVVDHLGSHEIDVLKARAEVALFTAQLEQADLQVAVTQRQLDEARRSGEGVDEAQDAYDEAKADRDEIAAQLDDARRRLAALEAQPGS